MKKINPGFLWAGFFVLIGVFLLLSNLNVLGPWGDAVWGGLFVVAGLVFLAAFIKDRLHRWEAVAGTTLISGGAVILLEWQNVNLGDYWTLSIVLLGLALGFWLIALFRREDWWAILPAGVLTLTGLLLGLGRDLAATTFNALFLIGLGGVFALIYLLRLRSGDARWALVPAVAFALLGLVWLVDVNETSPVWMQWWPVLLIGAGLILGFVVYSRRKQPAAATKPAPAMQEPDLPTASGASRVENIPESSAENVDIYELIKNQPKE
jgi:drug/metabolite transporter superfamily protein YnfA